MHILHGWIKFMEHFRSGENMEVVSTWKFFYKKDITNDWFLLEMDAGMCKLNVYTKHIIFTMNLCWI